MKERTEEEKEMRRYSIHRIGVTVIQAIAFALAIWLLVGFINGLGIAEDLDWEDEGKYILCMDLVNIRMSPNTKQEPIGWLEPGDIVYPDGKRRNGFIHCEIPNIEAGEGWIHKGYMVDDPPEKVNQRGVIVGRGFHGAAMRRAVSIIRLSREAATIGARRGVSGGVVGVIASPPFLFVLCSLFAFICFLPFSLPTSSSAKPVFSPPISPGGRRRR